MESIDAINGTLRGLGDVVQDSETDPQRAINRVQAAKFASLIREDTQPLPAACAAFGIRAIDILIALQLRGVIPPTRKVWEMPQDQRNERVMYSRTFLNNPHPDTIPCPSAIMGQGPYKLVNPSMVNSEGVDYAGVSGRDHGTWIFGAPMDDSAYSIAIRAHEYSHIATFRAQPKISEVLYAGKQFHWLNDGTLQAGMDNIANSYALAHGVEHVRNLKQPSTEGGYGARCLALLQSYSFLQNPLTYKLDAEAVKVIRETAYTVQAIGANLDHEKNFQSWDIVAPLIHFTEFVGPLDTLYQITNPQVYREHIMTEAA